LFDLIGISFTVEFVFKTSFSKLLKKLDIMNYLNNMEESLFSFKKLWINILLVEFLIFIYSALTLRSDLFGFDLGNNFCRST